MSLTKDDSYTTANKYCACIEFHLDEERRNGFHTSQLVDYTLEPNPDAGENKNAPPQKLTLAFSTANVVILGWRLDRLADLLRENDLATVHVLPTCYADLDCVRPFVASILFTGLSGGDITNQAEATIFKAHAYDVLEETGKIPGGEWRRIAKEF